MNCPKCEGKLVQKEHEGITVDACNKCGGMWFEFEELDTLEDKVLPRDDMKGTLVWDKKPAKERCPECGNEMLQFDYRFNNLHLEYCEKNMHGFWLDKGEGDRVLEEMTEAVEGLERKFKAEEEWANTLKRLKSKSFFTKLMGLFQ